MNVVSIWVPIAICVGVIASIAGVYWAWYRALHDEHGPAFIATAVTVVAFIGLLWTLNATVKAPTLPQSNTESWD